MERLVVHYSEIGTKGKNRKVFERILIKNIKRAIGGGISRVYRDYGRIVLYLDKNIDSEAVSKKLEKIPGIANFMFATRSSLNIEEIKKKCIWVLNNITFKSFRISSSRSNKRFSVNSQELNRIVGSYVIEKMDKVVDLENPDVNVYVEICEREAFIGIEKKKGVGGLPVGSSGKLICSLSGGIDSPVASWLMMKRGCKIVFGHIYNSTQTKEVLLEKVNSIVKQLSNFQLESKIYVIPFERIQKEIIIKIPAKFRMIIYRRFMMRILNEIAKKEKAKGIVTGDSIGQVASQTIENLNCIYDASKLPVFAPLIGMSKEEIIRLSREIGTYKYSIIDYPDCCSFMIAKHPETKGRIDIIKKLGESIENHKELIKMCLGRASVKSIKSEDL